MRDPRTDPRPGDIIENEGMFVRVYHRTELPDIQIISFMVLTRNWPVPHVGSTIEQWRSDAATATIIHVAES